MYSRPLTSYSLDPEPRLTMNARSSGNRDDPRTPPGSARAVPAVDGRRRARPSATSQVLRTLLRAGDVQATVEPTGEGVAILESEVLSTGEGTFVESGTISYGDAGRVAFRTVGQGVTG